MKSLFVRKAPQDFTKLLKLQRNVPVHGIGLKGTLFLLFLSFVLSFVLMPTFTLPQKTLVEGELSPSNIKAQRSFEIMDEESTQKLKDATESSVKSIYDYDPDLYANTVKKLFKAFERIRKDGISSGSKKSFEEALGGIRIEDALFSFLVQNKFNWKISWSVNRLLNLLKNRYVVSEKGVFEPDLDRGIAIRNMGDKKEIYFDEFGHILDVSEAKKIVFLGSPKIYQEYKGEERKFVGKLAESLISPTISLNKEETMKRKERAVSEIKPVMIKLKNNEMIIRKGDSVQKRHLVILKGIKKELTEQRPGLFMFFMAVFFFFFFQILGYFPLVNFFHFKPSQKDVLVLAFLMLLTLVLCRGYFFIVGAICDKVAWLPSSMFMYLIPIATGAMMARFLAGMEAALIFSIVMSVALGFFLERNFLFSMYALSSSLMAMNGVVSCKATSDIYKAGFKTGLINMAIVFSIVTLSALGISEPYETLALEMLFGVGAAFFSGILASFFVVTITPLCEYLFNYTTDIKLLELSNLNNPILRELMLRSPGSYHHCIMVGTLSEAAAETVGANALLARVGGYYHDIGKMKNPHYYIENQFGEANIHDRQPAHLSKTMIMSHVKEGAKIGWERQLGKPVIDIIEQHLGTTLMMYFYEKAKKEYEERVQKDELLPPVQESDFRYPGPKPQTVEAAIVMMADAVEASTRALNTSNLSRLQSVCEKLVNRLFIDGQLNDCELTLKDLHKIVDSFYHVLVGMYHRRIGYPGSGVQAEKSSEKSYDANYYPKQTKEDTDPPEKSEAVDDNPLFKKIGS